MLFMRSTGEKNVYDSKCQDSFLGRVHRLFFKSTVIM